MKNIIIIAFLAFSFSVNSQITITSGDMPMEGETYIYSNAALDGIYNVNGGQNMNWDYSELTSTLNDSVEFVSVSNAPFSYQFLFNNPLIPNYLADFATSTEDFEIGGFATFSNQFTFFQNNMADYRALGLGVEVNGIPGVGTYNPIDIIYNFPMNYNDMDTSYSELELELLGLGHYEVEQTRRNFVDGFGTLTLPIGEYECLRVRTEIEATDSIYVELLGFGTQFERPLLVEYKWLTIDGGTPVLQVDETAGIISNIRYRDTVVSIVDGIDEFREEVIKFGPNPCQDYLDILSEKNRIQNVHILDNNGSIVYEFKGNEQKIRINTSEFTTGYYVVQVSTAKGRQTKLIFKE